MRNAVVLERHGASPGTSSSTRRWPAAPTTAPCPSARADDLATVDRRDDDTGPVRTAGVACALGKMPRSAPAAVTRPPCCRRSSGTFHHRADRCPAEGGAPAPRLGCRNTASVTATVPGVAGPGSVRRNSRRCRTRRRAGGAAGAARAGGRLVIPVGMPGQQDLVRITCTDAGFEREVLCPVSFVPLLEGTD